MPAIWVRPSASQLSPHIAGFGRVGDVAPARECLDVAQVGSSKGSAPRGKLMRGAYGESTQSPCQEPGRECVAGADEEGTVYAGRGWTDLVITPERGVRAVDGLLTGFHEPKASHLAMLEAIAGRAHLEKAYQAALEGGYLWHEFGDLHLILP